MYTKLLTYKKVAVDHRSKSLELLIHLPAIVYMSQAKSLQLLQKAPTKLGKAYGGL
jgi:hypothetical protein